MTFIPTHLDHFKAIDIQFKDGMNPYKELKSFDQENFPKDQSKYYKINEETLNSLLDFAKFLHSSQLAYLDSTRSVLLNTENMEDLLYSIVLYDNQVDNSNNNNPPDINLKPSLKQRAGVFLRIKYDHFYQDYLIFIRLL